MKLSEKYSLQTQCYITEKGQGVLQNAVIRNIFEDFHAATEELEKQNRPLSDLHYAYVVVDQNGKVPEELEEIYFSPEDAVKDFLSKQ